MIHVLPVLTVILCVSSAPVSSAVAATADVDWDSGELEVLGTCDSETGECISGHTSLLQESMNLIGHYRHHHHREAHLEKSNGKSSSGQGTAVLLSRTGLKKFSKPSTMGILIAGAALAVMFFLFVMRPAMANPASPRDFVVTSFQNEESHKRIHDPHAEDTYSLAIVILVRDLRSIALGEKPGLKMSRIAFALALVAVTIFLQISVVVCTKQFVTPSQVADIRDAYDNFEQVMYNHHTYLNAQGKHRGITGYFNASAFGDLDDDGRENACNIPMSQLGFLFLILMVWSITCVARLRENVEMFLALIYFAETKENMKDCLVHWQDAIGPDSESEEEKDKVKEKPMETTASRKPVVANVQVITGLTLNVKVFLVLCVFLPEFCTTCYVLWLGSRWLTATNSFGDIICNVVALEFILQMKKLLFLALASERNKRDLCFTGLVPSYRKEHAGFTTYFNSLIWPLLSCIWVYTYIFHLQQVLPDYKWDVHEVCSDWLLNLLSASGDG